MAKKEKRFVKVYDESSMSAGQFMILADRETGVHYLVTSTGYGGGVTPLLGRDGQPYIAAVYDEN